MKSVIAIVNGHLIVIPFLAICGMFMTAPYIVRYSVVFIFLSFIFYPIVYGRLTELALNLAETSPYHLLKSHWLNYLLTVLCYAVPIIVITNLTPDTNPALQNLIAGLFQSLIIYVMPQVFIKREVLHSILSGVSFLFNNFMHSIPLILLTLSIFFVKLIFNKLIAAFIQPEQLSIIFGIGFIQNIINVYLVLIIFTAAIVILKDRGEGIIKQGIY